MTGTGPIGKTAAGNRINWVFNYQNNTTSAVNLNITDPIGANQTYVPGSLKLPSYLSSQFSTDGGTTWVIVQRTW